MAERIRSFEDIGPRVGGPPPPSTPRGRKKTVALSFETPDRETEQAVLSLLRETIANAAAGMPPAVSDACFQLAAQVPRK